MKSGFLFRMSLGLIGLLLSGVARSQVPVESSLADPPQPPDLKEAVEVLTAAQRLEAVNLVEVEGLGEKERKRYRAEMRGAFEEEKFDDLNRKAREARQSKALFADGGWKVSQVYNALDLGDVKEGSVWEADEKMFQKWAAATPDDPAPWIAMADFYLSYAWLARGGGFASTVSSVQWGGFRSRLKQAQEALEKADERGGREDPYWYAMMSTLALGQQWPASQFEGMVEEGLGKYPTFWSLACRRAYSLLPRWYGKRGDWERFAEEQSLREDGLGAEVYARIVIYLLSFYDNIFTETDASWPRTRDGLNRMMEKYPDDLGILNQAALLAWMAKDREIARPLLDRMGNAYVKRIWENPEKVILARKWAQSEP